MQRFYIERKPGFDQEAARALDEIKNFLGVDGVTGARVLNRYDVDGVDGETARLAAARIFSEPQSDFCVAEKMPIRAGETAIVWEYLPGQFDQRADSAEQCLALLRAKKPIVRCAKIILLSGEVSAADVEKIQKYFINPVDSRATDDSKPSSLEPKTNPPPDIKIVENFIKMDDGALKSYGEKMSLAMDSLDLRFLQDYFKKEGRDPTETEIRALDTYWSDHCRHTTFLTEIKKIEVEDGPYAQTFRESLALYKKMREELCEREKGKPVTLMDMAVIGAKYLRSRGKLDDLEISDENNACSVYIDVHFTTDKNGSPIGSDSPDATERWLLMFKNETHNHPTEIEPFGGAATCIGGAIRDPLSGRAWVYQSMRVTGAADPTVPLAATIKGKLPQIKLCREAAQGFSSYGNQIGLTTGQVAEFYHDGFAAKRMETGAVIAAAPASAVKRETPEPGDVVILLGGGTGRDGIGGATGSSKVHTQKSVETAAAEVQKGNAVEERKIQRLFRNEAVSRMIKRSNDFGAGGVAVAVGELAPGLDINLDAVPKKYEGLDGTELAISESQERMAVVVREGDAKKFIDCAADENLRAVVVAKVTDTNRLVMRWRGKTIVDLARDFLDAAGAHHSADALIKSPAPQEESPLARPLASVEKTLGEEGARKPSGALVKKAWLADMGDLACCSQRGLCERFDGSIGASSVLFPFGGRFQSTPEAGMAAKIPAPSPRETSTASLMAFGYDPRVAEWSAWHGAQIAVLSSLSKITCMGGRASTCRLSFQEFFGRAVDPCSWGHPAAALLGALDAQERTGCAAIGGKDSMSGTFENLNVPHTLVSFAVAHDEAERVSSGAFKKAGSAIYLVSVPCSPALAPDFGAFKKNSETLYRLNADKKISAMYPVCAGGIAEAVTKMAMGNRIGAKIFGAFSSAKDLFVPRYGAIVVEADSLDKKDFVDGTLSKLGETTRESAITIEESCLGCERISITIDEAQNEWEKTLRKVFPQTSNVDAQKKFPDFALRGHKSLEEARAKKSSGEKASATKGSAFSSPSKKPLVLLPVFPGTNCEYDMARAFNLAGAETKILVFANNTPVALERSLDALQNALRSAQILALSGGFSAGDEPDGSGKFIANVLRESRVADRVMELLTKRDGLVLGICNGFQALVKTGLLPFGEIRDMDAESPTLTFNCVGRHISRVARTRMVSAMSPWARDESMSDGRVHLVPISHGEGRVVVSEKLAQELFERGQVFAQYVGMDGLPATTEPDNPNGSLYAIEALTSPDGRVLGKMGHSERTICARGDLLKNIACLENESLSQNLFAAGARYFA